MNNLNYDEMLSDSAYKENHRLQMVEWSTEVRKKDPNYFLRLSIEENKANQCPVWILTDARRQCDIEFFEQTKQFKKANTKLFRLRISASDECRQKRGFVFTPSVDDAETECGLDQYSNWDFQIKNEDLTEQQLIDSLRPVIDECKTRCSSS